jgi:hypothetical protein
VFLQDMGRADDPQVLGILLGWTHELYSKISTLVNSGWARAGRLSRVLRLGFRQACTVRCTARDYCIMTDTMLGYHFPILFLRRTSFLWIFPGRLTRTFIGFAQPSVTFGNATSSFFVAHASTRAVDDLSFKKTT